jgi:predicted MFS family arabinose efflux permease
MIVGRWGSRRTVAANALLLSVALAAVAGGAASPVLGVAVVVVGFVLLGFANGAWDVAMNVQGARVERLVGRAVMPRLHAAFSLGTVAGALTGAAMVALEVPVPGHFAAVALLAALVVPRQVRTFLPEEPVEAAADPLDGETAQKRTFWTSWREPRTLLVGLVVLTFALAEGVGNDWIGVALIDGHGTASAAGALGFAVFVTAMTAGRWFGPGLLDRYGRVAVVRACVALALLGLALFVGSPWVGLAFAGLVLWGLGASLGFPVGMSAAADDEQHAASRVSVVASIGYCAFLAGPPLIGMLGEEVTVLRALAVLSVPLLLSLVVVPALKPPTATASAAT